MTPKDREHRIDTGSPEERVKAKWPDAEPWRSYGRWRIYDGPQSMLEARQPLGDWRGSRELAWADAASRLETK